MNNEPITDSRHTFLNLHNLIYGISVSRRILVSWIHTRPPLPLLPIRTLPLTPDKLIPMNCCKCVSALRTVSTINFDSEIRFTRNREDDFCIKRMPTLMNFMLSLGTTHAREVFTHDRE